MIVTLILRFRKWSNNTNQITLRHPFLHWCLIMQRKSWQDWHRYKNITHQRCKQSFLPFLSITLPTVLYFSINANQQLNICFSRVLQSLTILTHLAQKVKDLSVCQILFLQRKWVLVFNNHLFVLRILT